MNIMSWLINVVIPKSAYLLSYLFYKNCLNFNKILMEITYKYLSIFNKN